MIAVIDYGMGNSGSIVNMIKKVGGSVVLSADPAEALLARALILPGVGAFDSGMGRLHEGGFSSMIGQALAEGKFLLGICLGMQLLFSSSEEGCRPGLGLIPGKVVRFDRAKLALEGKSIRIPHMGWNRIQPTRDNALFQDLPEARFYFVHSYHAQCAYEDDVLANSCHGYSFPSVVGSGKILGVQFHPEKSHRFGMHFFKNYLEMINA